MADLGPRVVAIGGGHGLATVLTAVRRYAGAITAVVTVADDGGSSGRLRRDLGVPPPGDLRRALVALADSERVWTRAFEHRVAGGDLRGHAVGNLVLAALTEDRGDFEQALDAAGALLGAAGSVLPATVDPVDLTARIDGRFVAGQVAVATATGRIERVALAPGDARAPDRAVREIAAADQVVLAPGSLFTSLLAAAVVPGIRDALAMTAGRVVLVGNVCPDVETSGMTAADHVAAVLGHGVRVDAYLAPEGGRVPLDRSAVEVLGPVVVEAPAGDPTLGVHDPRGLASALGGLL